MGPLVFAVYTLQQWMRRDNSYAKRTQTAEDLWPTACQITQLFVADLSTQPRKEMCHGPVKVWSWNKRYPQDLSQQSSKVQHCYHLVCMCTCSLIYTFWSICVSASNCGTAISFWTSTCLQYISHVNRLYLFKPFLTMTSHAVENRNFCVRPNSL